MRYSVLSVFVLFFSVAIASQGDIDICAFGVRETNLLQTVAIQKAIDAAGMSGGGTVRVPKGVYRTGGLVLRSGVTLHLGRGATLVASSDPEDYPGSNRWYRALIRADGAKDVAIVGEEGSVLDGVNCYDPFGEENFRGPHAVMFIGCTNVTLRGYTVRDSANWAHAIFHCGKVRISDLRVLGGHDAIDFHDSENVTVERCELRTGDDSIAGFGNYRCTVRDCVLDSSCNAIRFGGADCLFERCRTSATPSYLHRYVLTEDEKRRAVNKPAPADGQAYGGFIYYCDTRWTLRHRPGNIVVRDCTFARPRKFLSVNFDGRHIWCCNRPLASVTFENCSFLDLDRGADVYGGEEDPIAITFRNCRFTASTKGKNQPLGSFYNFSELVFDACRYEGYAKPTLVTRSRGKVAISGGDALGEAYRPDPADKILSFAEIRAALAGLPADEAAFGKWADAFSDKSGLETASPLSARWNEEKSFYMCADDPSRRDIWGTVMAVWRGDARSPRIVRRLWSGSSYFVGFDRSCAVCERDGGRRAQEPIGPFAYGLFQVKPLYARAYLTDFTRLPEKSPAAVAGVLQALSRIE